MNRKTEKFYVIGIILVGAIILVVALVSGYKVISGQTGARPGYESAAPPFIVGVPDFTVIDTSKLADYPITDRDFLYLHRSTRRLAPTIAGVSTTASDFAALTPDTTTATSVSAAVNMNASLVANTTTNISHLSIQVNQTTAGKAKTDFTVNYSPKNVSEAPVVVAYTLFFERRSGHWVLADLKPVIGSDYGSDPGATAPQGETAPNQANPDFSN